MMYYSVSDTGILEKKSDPTWIFFRECLCHLLNILIYSPGLKYSIMNIIGRIQYFPKTDRTRLSCLLLSSLHETVVTVLLLRDTVTASCVSTSQPRLQ